jgi:hypothetical protein
MKAGDRVRVATTCRSLIAPKGMCGRLEDIDSPRVGFLRDAWLVRLDNRDLVLCFEGELEPAADQ